MSLNVSTCRSGSTRRCVSASGLMSRIATKPSALCTWSPSATSPQKRQSSCSDGKDSLLGECNGARFDQPTDLRIEQPGRVVVAIASPGPVDENTIRRAHLRLPPPVTELIRELAQT